MTMAEEMFSGYTTPAQKDQIALISAVKRLQQTGKLTLELRKVGSDNSLPWNSHYKIFDAVIELKDLSGFFSEASILKKIGSGVSSDMLAGSCHAISENFERLFVTAGGQKSLRKTQNDVFEVFSQQWITLPCDPLKVENNPDYSRSAEAFHLYKGEALRAAYCELLEREALCSFNNQKEQACDITDYAINTVKMARRAKDSWSKAGYSFNLLAIPSDWKTWVILAVVRNNKESTHRQSFRQSFKGNAADFNLSHAIWQAISELERNAFLGEGASCTSFEDVETKSHNQDTPAFVKEKMALMMDSQRVDRYLNATKSMTAGEIEERSRDHNPSSSLNVFKEKGKHLYLIPIAENYLDIPGYCYKFISPGLKQDASFMVRQGEFL